MVREWERSAREKEAMVRAKERARTIDESRVRTVEQAVQHEWRLPTSSTSLCRPSFLDSNSHL